MGGPAVGLRLPPVLTAMRRLLSFLVVLGCTLVMDFMAWGVALGEHNYIRGYEKPFELLEQTTGSRRIVLIGGSSIAWGISAQKLSSELGVPVVNFGIHAGVGYRRHWELLEGKLDPKTDTLLVSPEYGLPRKVSWLDRSPLFCQVKVGILREWSPTCTGFGLYRFVSLVWTQGEAYDPRGFNDHGDYIARADDRTLDERREVNDLCPSLDSDGAAEYRALWEGVRDLGFRVLYLPTVVPDEARCRDGSMEAWQREMVEFFGTENSSAQVTFFRASDFFDTEYHLTLHGQERRTAMTLQFLRSALEGGAVAEGGS